MEESFKYSKPNIKGIESGIEKGIRGFEDGKGGYKRCRYRVTRGGFGY